MAVKWYNGIKQYERTWGSAEAKGSAFLALDLPPTDCQDPGPSDSITAHTATICDPHNSSSW